MLAAGLDLGSVNTKLVVLENGLARYRRVQPSNFDSVTAGSKLLDQYTVDQRQQLENVVVTGYGRISFPTGKVVTEITCQAKGCHYYFPENDLILDVGGQDSKVIKKNPQGKVIQFMMNDKCAAGTGRFLDVILRTLELTPAEVDIPTQVKPVEINSMCTVFAESEVITLLAKGKAKTEVVAGLFNSIAKRLARFVESMGSKPNSLVFTGGGAHYYPLVHFLEKELRIPILIPPEPEMTAALGAALIAGEK